MQEVEMLNIQAAKFLDLQEVGTKEAACKTLSYWGRRKFKKKCTIGRMDMIFFPVKAEIQEKKIVEISAGNTPEISINNTPKSPDFQGKCTFSLDISSFKIEVVEISGGNKNLFFEKF